MIRIADAWNGMAMAVPTSPAIVDVVQLFHRPWVNTVTCRLCERLRQQLTCAVPHVSNP